MEPALIAQHTVLHYCKQLIRVVRLAIAWDAVSPIVHLRRCGGLCQTRWLVKQTEEQFMTR